MVFAETKIKSGFHYHLEDVFGTLDIDSEQRLNADTLDEIVVVLLRTNISAETLQGEVKNGDGIIKYKFVKAPAWSDDDEEKPCESTPTSTPEPGRGFIQITRFMMSALNWPRRFVVAFREAYKKAK